MITVSRESADGTRRSEWDMIDAGTHGVKINVYREFESRNGEWHETKAVGGDYWPSPPCPRDVLDEAKRRIKAPSR